MLVTELMSAAEIAWVDNYHKECLIKVRLVKMRSLVQRRIISVVLERVAGSIGELGGKPRSLQIDNPTPRNRQTLLGLLLRRELLDIGRC
eukprot:1195335-Prorocentrum_minimum.AAC.8